MLNKFFRVIERDQLIPIRNGVVVERGWCVHLMLSRTGAEPQLFELNYATKIEFRRPVHWLRVTLQRHRPRLEIVRGIAPAGSV